MGPDSLVEYHCTNLHHQNKQHTFCMVFHSQTLASACLFTSSLCYTCTSVVLISLAEQWNKMRKQTYTDCEREKKIHSGSLKPTCSDSAGSTSINKPRKKTRYYNQNLVIMKIWEPRRTLALNTSILVWHLIKAISISVILSTQTVGYFPLQKHWRAAWSTLHIQAREMVTLDPWPHDGQVKHSWWLRELEKRLLYTWEQKTLFSH